MSGGFDLSHSKRVLADFRYGIPHRIPHPHSLGLCREGEGNSRSIGWSVGKCWNAFVGGGQWSLAFFTFWFWSRRQKCRSGIFSLFFKKRPERLILRNQSRHNSVVDYKGNIDLLPIDSHFPGFWGILRNRLSIFHRICSLSTRLIFLWHGRSAYWSISWNLLGEWQILFEIRIWTSHKDKIGL